MLVRLEMLHTLASRLRPSMTKPTFFQALLNRPSQSYAYPKSDKRDYHSTKPLLVQIATADGADDRSIYSHAPYVNRDCTTHSIRIASATTLLDHDASVVELELHGNDSTSRYPKLDHIHAPLLASNDNHVYTWDTSLLKQSSLKSHFHDSTSSHTSRIPSLKQPEADATQPVPPNLAISSAEPLSDTSEEDEVFFTPAMSPRNSYLEAEAELEPAAPSKAVGPSPQALLAALAFSLPRAPPSLLSKSASGFSMDSGSPSVAACTASVAGDSVFSSISSVSTVATTPAQSTVDFTSVSRSSRRNSTSSRLSSSQTSIRSNAPISQATSCPGSCIDKDWSKEMHFLEPLSAISSVSSSERPLNKIYATRSSAAQSNRPVRRKRSKSMIISLSETTKLSKLNSNPPHPRPPKRSRSQHSGGKSRKSTLTSLAELPEPEAPRLYRNKTTGSQSHYTSAPRTVRVPSFGRLEDLPSIGTRGFTNLVLPRADFHSREPVLDTQSMFKRTVGLKMKTDITKNGLAQTTMATVEIVKGMAHIKKDTKWWMLGSAKTAKKSKTDSITKGFFGDFEKSPLAFTSWRSPPMKVNASCVMVQVWAIGVDEMDASLVAPPKLPAGTKGEPMPPPSVGFIPGRSFIGRVVECGWEVNEEDVKKGEWVIGLLEVHKSGAMAEFIIADRRRIHRAPHPSLESTLPPHSSISLEHLAMLPLCGLPALRAVSALSDLTNSIVEPRALVLQGHVGVGAMITQILARAGWKVTVHVPVPDLCQPGREIVPEKENPSADEDAEHQFAVAIEARVKSWGAHEILFARVSGTEDNVSSAIATINELEAEEAHFDAVLDTLGGRAIWAAGAALLGHDGGKGRFVTLIGDTPARVIPSVRDHFKAGMRSNGLGKARNERDQRSASRSANTSRQSLDTIKTATTSYSERSLAKLGHAGYVWVSADSDVDWYGRDVRESLSAVVRLALGSAEHRVLPYVDDVVPFEQAPLLFENGRLARGKTAVIRVVG